MMVGDTSDYVKLVALVKKKVKRAFRWPITEEADLASRK
jgi:hypothetical protein